MLVVFSPIFVAITNITFGYNFGASLSNIVLCTEESILKSHKEVELSSDRPVPCEITKNDPENIRGVTTFKY